MDQNRFTALSDSPILEILSFLPGHDLLKLSEVDHRFKDIISRTAVTMSMIRLVLDFEGCIDETRIRQLSETRHISTLRVIGLTSDVAESSWFDTIISRLAPHLEEVEFVRCSFGEIQLHIIIAVLKPNIKKCTLKRVTVSADFLWDEQEPPVTSGRNDFPLKELQFEETLARHTKFFFGCNRVERFEFRWESLDEDEDVATLKHFLGQQTKLAVRNLESYQHN